MLLDLLDVILIKHHISLLSLSLAEIEKLVEKLVERRMQNTCESQAEATANVLAAFEKLKKDSE